MLPDQPLCKLEQRAEEDHTIADQHGIPSHWVTRASPSAPACERKPCEDTPYCDVVTSGSLLALFAVDNLQRPRNQSAQPGFSGEVIGGSNYDVENNPLRGARDCLACIDRWCSVSSECWDSNRARGRMTRERSGTMRATRLSGGRDPLAAILGCARMGRGCHSPKYLRAIWMPSSYIFWKFSRY
jgi:hypothetical protein